MPRFFISGAPADGKFTITGDDAYHIAKVLRMRPGEALTVCDQAGTDYDCALSSLTPGEAVCLVRGASPSVGEPTVRVSLYMGLPKGDKMDFIVQKAVELGCSRVVPFFAARSVSRPDAKTLRKKCERWRKIAREAAMQCGRGVVAEVGEPLAQAQAAAEAAACDVPLFLYENERRVGLRERLAGVRAGTVSLMVGPEGGFAPEEADAAVRAGMASVSLGARILRCETAPLAALTAVMYESGNL